MKKFKWLKRIIIAVPIAIFLTFMLGSPFSVDFPRWRIWFGVAWIGIVILGLWYIIEDGEKKYKYAIKVFSRPGGESIIKFTTKRKQKKYLNSIKKLYRFGLIIIDENYNLEEKKNDNHKDNTNT